MRREAAKLLFDIADACAAIGTFRSGRNAADYQNDQMFRSACERKQGIIGEAMTRLRDSDRAVFDRIDDGYAIIGLRNRLIHGYDAVDSNIVWDVIDRMVPALGVTANALLNE